MIINIKCDIPDRWASHFIGMLQYMEDLGNMGSSRNVCFHADGDGDFNPTFEFSRLDGGPMPNAAEPEREHDGNRFYDAG